MSQRLDAVIALMRSWILTGSYSPGDRFPNREELLGLTGASLVTVQRAMKALAEDGFLQSRGRLGTFVTVNPPHHFRIGVVFSAEGHFRPSLFYEAIERAAGEAGQGTGYRFETYWPDSTDYPDARRQLEADLARGTLAGLIFVGPPSERFRESLILTQPEVVRIMLVSPGVRSAGIHPLILDPAPILDHALVLAGRSSRRRLAVISGGGRPELIDRLTTACRGRLTTRPSWVQVVDCCRSEQILGLVELLFSGPADARPDLLLLLDDNLVEPALSGLTAAGVVPGQDVLLIAQGNFPHLPVTQAPVTWLGYDMGEGFQMARRMIEQSQQGKRVRAAHIPIRLPEESV